MSTITPTFEPRDVDFNLPIPGIVRREQAVGKPVTFCDQFGSGVTMADTADGIHPNDAGYAKMADVWYAAIIELQSPTGRPSAPLHLRAASGPGQALLQWDTAYGAASYVVKRRTGNAGAYQIIARGVNTRWFTDTDCTDGRTYSYVVCGAGGSAKNDKTLGPPSNAATVAVRAADPIAINCGGPATRSFLEDRDYEGGMYGPWGYYDTMKLAGVTGPAPQDVYKTYRAGSFGYLLRGLRPGRSYALRLHFCEYERSAVGQRVFSVAINHTPVLSHFDIFAAGGEYNAVVKAFTVKPDAQGQVAIQLTSETGDASLSGIEIAPQQ